MKAVQSFAPQKKVTFSAAVTSQSMQNMILQSLGDQKSAARLTSTLISAVNASEQLRGCEATTIVASALRGEGMGLVYSHGYYIVPYGDKAQFSLSYKGMIQLAMASGLYADIDALEIREGEWKGRDKRTGKPLIDLATYDTDEERAAHPVIGYYAYYELKDGTFRYEYWPMEKLLKHADRYSPAFDLKKYEAMQNGELSASDVKRLLNGTPWYDPEYGQARMCKKTVLRQLLNSGYAPLSNEVRSYLRQEETEAGEPAIDLIDVNTEYTDPAEQAEETGAEAQETEDVKGNADTAQKRRGRPPKQAAPDQDIPLVDAEISVEEDFFGGN